MSDAPPLPPGDTPEPWPHPIRLRRLDVGILIALIFFAGAVRFVRLGTPGDVLGGDEKPCRLIPATQTCYEPIPLDETHYVPDARDVLAFGTESDQRVVDRDHRLDADDGAYVVHPPVGKWFIAAGIDIFGDRPFGWRFFGALFATAGVAIAYALGLRLWGSPWAAALGGLLLSLDGLWFVQSRVAMLDIYAAVFALLGIWVLVEDRARTEPGHRGIRWWRIAAGIAFGLAIATKWSVAPFLVAAIAVAIAWEIGRSAGAARRRLVMRSGAVAGSLIILPAAVYVLSFTPWFVDANRYSPCETDAGTFTRWRCYQKQVFDFHRNLDKFEPKKESGAKTGTGTTATGTRTTTAAATTARGRVEPSHPYFGEAWSWPWIGRPVVHDNDITCLDRAREGPCPGRSEQYEEVVGIPNPAVWWPAFFVGLPAIAWWSFRRDATAALLRTMFAAGWGPYLFADVVSRPVFLFYATPLVPFLALSVAHVWVRASRRWPVASRLAVAHVLVVAVLFAYFYPVLAAYPIAREGAFGWVGRMWLRADCTAQDVIKKLCWI